ncbi:carbohydrate esterase [Cadophora sp. M221]|nr:carbohydrate esterase [Cadophora sp. M221]
MLVPRTRFHAARTCFASTSALFCKVPKTVYIVVAMLLTAGILLLVAHVIASPAQVGERQSCPKIHIFGARETTAPAGYGTAGTVVNLVLGAFPGSTAEAILYPACGGQSNCGGKSYGASALEGTGNVAKTVNAYNTKCPTTQLVLVGYSQGGQIMDNAFCGGGDSNIGLSDTKTPIQESAIKMIKAAIFMGDPRHIPGLPYNVGTCKANGFAPRPSGFVCPVAASVQSYCDSPDPYCCNGNDANAHQQYGNKYGQAALTFIKSKLTA